MRALPPILLLAAVTSACAPPRTAGPLPHQAFVWQRSWSPAVVAAARSSHELGLSGLVALAAEVRLDRDPPEVVRVPVDLATLAAAGPVALALRIGGQSRGEVPFPAQRLAALAAELVAASTAHGVALAELQIDHDCPTRRLGECAELLAALRARIVPVPLTFTALPTWLDERASFARLLAASDGFVLQVHSLELPANGSAKPLCDPALAHRAVERAASFGRPFRVALPTHAYVVTFTADGRLADVAAEDAALGPLPFGASGRRQIVGSDPAALAQLVADWTRSRPSALVGVLWYRLPVPGDRFNWTPAALRATLQGRAPARRLEIAVRRPSPGLAEIDLVNLGDNAEPAPERIELRWSGTPPVAGDGVAGYRLAPSFQNLELDDVTSPALQLPGERRTIAWLRFNGPENSLGGHLAP